MDYLFKTLCMRFSLRAPGSYRDFGEADLSPFCEVEDVRNIIYLESLETR